MTCLRLLLITLAFAPCSLAAPEPGTAHTFRLSTADWNDQPESVYVAGTFNGWDKSADRLTPDDDGQYTASIDLDPGVTLYKFVIDNERWISDPRHSDKELEVEDGHGGINSAVLIGKDPRKWDPPKPNHINAEGLEHNPEEFTHRSVVSQTLLLLGIATQADDVQRVVARVISQRGETSHEMTRETSSLGRDQWIALVPIEPDGGSSVAYEFSLIDGSEQVLLGENGTGENIERFTVNMTPTFTTPDWAKHAVWYQIFPERFRNGDPANDPGEMEYETLLPWDSDWWKAHTQYGETRGEENFYDGDGNVWARRYGGDLQGVQEALPYLRQLGVNAIYFNPVFEADSMHKYDTADYRHIDDNFGVKAPNRFEQVEGETDDPATWGWSASDKVFLGFLDEAHAQGFHIVIDGVFNHVGTSHPFFQDVLKNGRESRYADWFEVTDWGPRKRGVEYADDNPRGIQYNAWDKPSGALPVFKNDPVTGLADGPKQHIFDITRRWMDPNGDGDPSDGIDGWRLDVPGDIAHPFWVEWRTLVKSINPDAYISGEIWQWAHAWLQGDQFDAVMNYQYAMPAQDFFVDQKDAIAPSEFAQRLSRVAYGYPMQVSLAQMNLFDSHDTDRLASMFVNPDRPYDGQNRIQDNGPDYNPRKPNATEQQRMRQAVVNQMTFVGAPMIYYGTETGMWGPDDPSDRMPMTWPDLLPYEDKQITFDQDLFGFYQRLIAIRDGYEALQLGAFRVLLTDDARGVLAYERSLGDRRVAVVQNRSPKRTTVELPLSDGAYVNLLDAAAATVEPIDTAAGGSSNVRPKVVVRDGAPLLEAADRTLSVKLEPYGSAILVEHGHDDSNVSLEP